MAAPGTITFLPYLSGERTPHNDAAIRGVFAGLSHEHDRNDMTRAVLEGDAFGAARLGLIADTGEAPLEICFEPTIAETIERAAAMADAFEQAFERYRALYPAISSIGKRLCY